MALACRFFVEWRLEKALAGIKASATQSKETQEHSQE
jgi:hypothetical protein